MGHWGRFIGHISRGIDSRGFHVYHSRLVQAALYILSSGSSGFVPLDGYLISVLPPSIESNHRTCFVCDEATHVSKDHPIIILDFLLYQL